jgi:hypothetical protein
MDSLNRQDYLNRADVYGVRILIVHGCSVNAEIHFVYKRYLIWVKPDFSIPTNCHHCLFVYPFKVPAFDINDSVQNSLIQILIFRLEGKKVINGG